MKAVIMAGGEGSRLRPLTSTQQKAMIPLVNQPMMDHIIRLLKEHGLEELSLNFAAFAKWMHSPSRRHERVLGKLIALGNPFFQIESLYRFNAKFFPRWEPRYLLYEGALGLPRAALAVMWAEGQLPKPRRRVTVEAESRARS